MKFQNDRVLAVGPDLVWAALNDDAVLQRCIPGCESLSRVEPQVLQATVALSIGPVKARFAGSVRFEDVQPLQGYRMVFEGKGGMAGFGKGEAQVRLTAEPGERTRLAYVAEAHVGGKIAQVGARLIDAASQKIAGDFFSRFEQELERTEPAGQVPVPAPATAGASGVRRLLVRLRSCWTRLSAAVQ